jgi:DNA polymerase I-like protein with 3'-5' exonuclease and polymerase domains
MGACIGPRRQWFRKGTQVCTVGLREISEKVTALVFSSVQPVEAITAAERFAEIGVLRKNDKGEMEFVAVSMKRECAGMLMAAPQFREQLPAIVRILDVRLPIRLGNEIVFPESGYDPRFRSYCPPDAPEPEPMGLAEAKVVLHELHAEFCWKDLQSLTHAIARLITPYCRGLMGWDARFPLWHYAANRPRAGKDYLAVIPGYLYQGWLSEDAPLDRDTEETRKRITAALMSGRRNLHFANCQGFIQDPHFIGAITSKTFSARNLGSTDARADLVLPNEIEFSLSANVGLTFREDIEPRTRRIALEFFDENPNSRHFARTDLHGWVLTHRPRVLGAVAALVQHWIAQGCPPGPTPFNSFPEWARIVGGIMVSCGLGDPCLPHDHQDEIGGDRQENALRSIFRIGYENHPDEWIEKAQLFELIEAAAEDEALAFFCREGDLGSRSSKVRIGQALRQFRGRQLGGIQLLIEPNSKSQRQRVKFAQPAAPERVDLCHLLGQVGQVGHINALQKLRDRSEGRALPTEPGGAGGITGEKGAQPAQPAQPAQSDRRPLEPREIRHLASRTDLAEVADDLVLSATGRIALDLETYGNRKGDGLDPWRGDIRLLTLCREDGPVWMLDLRAIGYDLGPLAALLRTATLVIHNAKFDLLWLRLKFGLDCRRVCCTLTAARLLTAGTPAGNTLDDCLKRHLGIEPGPDHSRSDWGSPLLLPEQFAYASRDVAHLHELAGALEGELQQEGLGPVWQLEMALLPCVVDMEDRGIAVDREKLQAIAARQRALASESAGILRAHLGVPDLNLSSPNQLLSALRSAGLDLKSTRENELKAADDGRIIPLILQYRAAEKRAQQAESLIEPVKSDGRIHARFEPTGTMTGRFSSKEPNLQNVGRGELREAFVPAPGHRFIVADYSQVELRAAAAIAGETKMIEAYREGADLHTRTASTVLGADPASISKEQRQTAKAVSFGLLYGQSVPGLMRYAASSYGVALQDDEARRIRGAFFRTYGHLRQWHGESHQQAERGVTEVRTRLGRRRLVPEGASDWDRFTALVNTPVQGGCADGMKQAIVLLSERLPAGARIVSTVHDELIVEAPEAEAETVLQLVIKTMREAMAGIFPEVPIEIEGGVCHHWGEK